MGVLPSSSGRAAALSLRQPAGALRMAGGPPAGIVKMLDFQSKVMGVVYSLQGKEKPFTLQMRDAAMALHTFSQAPREGKVRDMTADTVVEQWEASQSEFMQFLVDSREVYAAFDEMVVKPENNIFENSGLERVEAINKDIILINTKWGLPTPAPNQAAVDYAAFVKTLSPQAFVTHFYNFYFAHTAGGMSIGKKVMDGSFEGHMFDFYQWYEPSGEPANVKALLQTTRNKIDKFADGWTDAQKKESLGHTADTFVRSQALLDVLVGKARGQAARVGFSKDEQFATTGGKISSVPVALYTANKNSWDA
ncbi:hypothetical protein T484DRAFT_1954368 [Baffinella frigidus]|nr:hypothetical protein T484DRAFT_1954368 [Cryptophyta sp. CCMP2293]